MQNGGQDVRYHSSSGVCITVDSGIQGYMVIRRFDIYVCDKSTEFGINKYQ